MLSTLAAAAVAWLSLVLLVGWLVVLLLVGLVVLLTASCLLLA